MITGNPHYNQKTARLSEEEQRIREENLEARPKFSAEGLKRLQAGICLQAMADYKAASRGRRIGDRDPETVMAECERFFGTDIFKATSGVHNPKKVTEAIRRIPAGYDHVFERRK